MLRQFLPMALCPMVFGCALSEPNYTGSYVGGDQSALIQLQIVEGDGGNLNGSFAVSTIDYKARKLKQSVMPITGIRKGEQFSLLAHHIEWGASDAPLSLEGKNHSLFWKIAETGQTVELSPMNQDQYRAKLNEFASALNANDYGFVREK